MALDRSPESFSPQMNSTFFVPFVPTCDPRGGANFDPKGHHKNKIDKGLQGDVTYQKFKLYPFQFQRRRILKFQLVTPRILIKVHKEILNTKFETRRILKLVLFGPKFQLITPGAEPVLTPEASYE